jgi:hypothetical protein
MTVSGRDATMAFDIQDHHDHVEVRGIGRDDIVTALKLFESFRRLQADQAQVKRSELVQALMVSEISLTPPATVAQARRLALARDALLASGVLTHDTLQQLRGDKNPSATRTWLSRARAKHELFTVTHLGRALIPAFQFNEQGEPRPELQPLIAVLAEHDVDAWSMWTWLTRPTSFLSGQVPEQVAHDAAARAVKAATRFVALRVA